MIEIVTDSSSLYGPAEAEASGFHVAPIQVLVDGVTLEDFVSVSSAEMNRACMEGCSVSTSQPSLGKKIDLYDRLLEDPDVTILDITLCDGLSGTYQSALMAKEACADPGRVVVFDSQTLCGAQKKMVEHAVMLRDRGEDITSILAELEEIRTTELSTVIVPEIGFVLRGGRLPGAAIKVGEMLRLMLTVKKFKGANALSLLGAARTFKKSWENILHSMRKEGMDASYKVVIAHADNEKHAAKACSYFKQEMPGITVEITELCPAFVIHGGPGCLSICAVRTDGVRGA